MNGVSRPRPGKERARSGRNLYQASLLAGLAAAAWLFVAGGVMALAAFLHPLMVALGWAR